MHLLAETLAAWNLPLSSEQLDQFACYAGELAAWNERLNLTAVADEAQIVRRHFVDSLSCALVWGQPLSLVDIGSGAGFPGLPLKILRPGLQLTLVESIGKKAAFLKHMAELLGLSDVTVLAVRAEDLAHHQAYRERYDCVTARAVAALPTLAEYCLPLCRLGGRWLAQKGGEVGEELQGAQAAIATLGGGTALVEQITIDGLPSRTIVIVPKAAPTPPAYPRRAGVPERKPLS